MKPETYPLEEPVKLHAGTEYEIITTYTWIDVRAEEVYRGYQEMLADIQRRYHEETKPIIDAMAHVHAVGTHRRIMVMPKVKP